jgi:hypothetical protein
MRRAFRTGLIILFYPHVSMMHVIISRCFAARFGHVVNCALKHRGRQGASYSGGRLGIAAAGVKVGWGAVTFNYTLPGPANPKRRLN